MSSIDKNKAILAESTLFDEAWYLATYPDVAPSGLSAVEHFLRFGARLGRDPGPKFSTTDYLSLYPDVKAAEINPLVHFESAGRREGRLLRRGQTAKTKVAPPTSRLLDVDASAMAIDAAHASITAILGRKLDGVPKRTLAEFNYALQEDFVAAASTLYQKGLTTSSQRYDEVKVSVVMPTFNRGDRIGRAIASVIAQSHVNFELLVVDDGSNDNSADVLADLAKDPRIRLFRNDHQGVSAARNTGLANATGDLIFYLDSDNVWMPDFLAAMIVAFDVSGKNCIYAASRLQDRKEVVLGYRGEPFDWQHCLSGNYIDMNVFGHRAAMVAQLGPFDRSLQRMVDWDLILRYTGHSGAAYCPVLGCIYFEDAHDATRISTSKPYIYRKLVKEKNRLGLANTTETFDRLSLKFAIKIPAPFKVRQVWGDFHFAESLKDALVRLGHEVRIDFLEDWDKHQPNSTDATIVLRGLSSYVPKPSEFSILWNISHPDQISYEEYASYKLIFVASASYAALLSKVLKRDVHALLQCTDSTRFTYRPHENRPGARGVFVGNSRNEYRDIVRWAVEGGVPLDIYGERWEQFLPDGMVRQTSLPNEALAAVYAGAQFVLNDHWPAMRDFGFLSNRIFDVIGCGGRLVSDYMPSIGAIFGDCIQTVESATDLRDQMAAPLPPVAQAARRAAAEMVHAEHSFDRRATEIVRHIRKLLLPEATPTVTEPASRGPRRKRVGLFFQQSQNWPTSSAFIRLIAPLTTDYAISKIDLVYMEDPADPKLADCDLCIVQRVAFKQPDDADLLIDRLERLGIPLYVDTDDAFYFNDKYKTEDAILQKLMEHAQETWFSTATLRDYYNDVPGRKHIFRNNLDPRFWRNYRKPVSASFTAPHVRFVYMGTATHNVDFDLILPAFERLHRDMPGTFDLTLIGAVRNPPKIDWLKRLNPPANKGSYPDFVRWLAGQADFDVGIAPLVMSAFNDAKSDVKVLDYAAMGLLPLVSDCPAYRDAIDTGLAVACGPTSDDWYEKAADLILNRASYEPMRAKTLTQVWESRNVLKASAELVDRLLA